MIQYANLFYPLIVAIITGLSWVAYKHPKGYKKIFYAIMPLIIMVLLMGVAANIGSLASGISWLSGEVAKQSGANITMIKSIADGISRDFNMLWKIIVIALVVIGYMIFLYFLPNILGISSNEEKK